ncbi:MAG: dethiobiotin synthase [Deltaproteobacteria bacterium]|nr:dethiobiotin synthase [Deltaproteobacteria bacterium]
MTRLAWFITATDTGAGKTTITAGLAAALRRLGRNVGVMKPIETGCGEDGESLVAADAAALKAASGSDDPLYLINPYRFARPLSPRLSARLEGAVIDFGRILAAYDALSRKHDLMLVEGAGGLLAPVADDKTMADVAALLGLPVVIVAPSRLGVINHALLTVEAAHGRGIKVSGIILNNPAQPGGRDESGRHNRAEIERLAKPPVLGEVGFMRDASALSPEEESVFDGIATALAAPRK